MAIAGKVAITLSAENNGAWSADVTYDRLVAVKHNNNLYISRKTVANVEPPNDDFWFLALEGFGGDDVQALIDRMNELSDLIQAIINGTTQVGNAKTLDGHGAEYFFPKSGGKVANPITHIPLELSGNKNIGSCLLRFLSGDSILGYLGFDTENRPFYVPSSGSGGKELLHTGNKPTVQYTGTGESRTVSIGGVANAVVVAFGGTMALVSMGGAIVKNGSTITALNKEEVQFDPNTKNLILNTARVELNTSGYLYTCFSI